MEEKVTSAIESTVNRLGFELVRVCFFDKTNILQIMIDSLEDEGVNIDDCSKVSRTIAPLLDVKNPIPGPYNLEVSSPGINRPLTKPGHYKRFIGEEIKLKLHGKHNKYIIGKLIGAEDNSFAIQIQSKEHPEAQASHNILYTDVAKCNILAAI